MVSEPLGSDQRFLGDRYRIVRELGRGGMGIVYLGRDLRLDMDVAIKVRNVTHNEATLWLKREFRAIATLRHRNLVELYELVAHDRSCYFTMEYLPGLDPRQYVQRDVDPHAHDPDISKQSTREVAPLHEARTDEAVVDTIASAPVPPAIDFQRVRSVLAQLAEGLAFLHSRGVIHRDIKPSNAIVVGDTVKLLDFGLALERRRLEDDLAREGRIVGTTGYLAPEYLQRLQVSPAMDVYALGVLAFELITGATPYGGALGFLTRLAQRPPIPRPSTINPGATELDPLIMDMMAADPAARPSSLDVAMQLSGALSRGFAKRRALRFVGRGDELDHLATRIADPRPRGRLVLVTGTSGVGKTALIEEACRRSAGVPVWRGRCHDRERVPYRAFDAMIDDVATQLATEPTLVNTVEHPGALARGFPVLAPLIDAVMPLSASASASDLRVERERALGSLVQLMRALVPRGVIAIDDLQWADDDSLELLTMLVERASRPLTVIGSWTTDGAPPRLVRLRERLDEFAEELELREMPDGDLAQMIFALAPEAPTQRILAEARRAAGSPYLAELIGRELGHHQLVMPTGDPETRRLSHLGAAARHVTQLASLASGTTTFHELRDLAAIPSPQLASVLRELEEARVLRAMPSASGDPVYAFYHQRLRDAAGSAMTEDVRRERHARFATWYENATDRATANVEQIAYHWQHAGDPVRAQRWSLAAGDAAFTQLSWAVAADWYRRALDLEPTAASQDDPKDHKRTDRLIRSKVDVVDRPLRAKLGDALFFGGNLAEAAEHYLVLAATAPDADHWRVRAAEAWLKLGELDRGLRVLDGVLARHGEHRAHSRTGSVTRALAVGARWLATPHRRRAGTPPGPTVLGEAYQAIARYLSTPQPIEAFEYILRSIALADRTGDAAVHSQGLAMLAGYLAVGTLGRFGDGLLARAEQLAEDSTTAYPRMVIAGTRGILCTARGDWQGMRAAHATGEEICKQLGYERSWEASFLRGYHGLGELYAGDHVRALTLFDELAAGTDDLFARALVGTFRGRALAVAGELSAARTIARQLDRSPHTRRGVAAVYRQVFEAELALAEHDWERTRTICGALASETRAQWLSSMPAISAMIEVPSAIAELGVAASRNDRAAAARARTIARRLYRRGRFSFYAATALRLQAQAEQLLGNREWRSTLERAASTRGAGEIDRLAIAALRGTTITPDDLGSLGPAVVWSTAGAVA